MQLSTHAPELDPQLGLLVRHNPLTDLIAAVVIFAAMGGGAYALTRAGGVPWFFWIVLGPMALIGGLIFLLIGCTMVSTFFASLRPTNWSAYVVTEGVFLNLRSYKNGHFQGDDPTVVYLPFTEIDSVGPVTETSVEKRERSEDRFNRTKMIELRLEHANTEPLVAACRAERQRPAPTTKRMGIESSTKHHDVPVFVEGPGILRVQWNAQLFDALRKQVTEVDARTIDLDEEWTSLSAEERATELAHRGKRLAAARVLIQEVGFSEREAKEWVKDAA